MSWWIGTTLHEQRERAGIEMPDIARILSVSDRTLYRLESGESMGRDIDRAVAAYAYVLGIEDGRELWHQAISRYQQQGSPPDFEATSAPAAAFAGAIREVSLRRRRDAAVRSRKPASTPRSQATGK